MTVAEIYGKISDSGTNLSERMEDLLTADIFGSMRYLPPEKALLPFLSTARSTHGSLFSVPDTITRVHCSFWPWLNSAGRSPCEPDVLIGLETNHRAVRLVMVEAKYLSGLSSEEDDGLKPNDQLARELDNLDVISPSHLIWKSSPHIISRTLLYVTQDMAMPHRVLERSLAEYRRKRNRDGEIFWTSWRFLPHVLVQSLEEVDSPENVAILEDMLQLLRRKGLTMFGGVEPVMEPFAIPDFYRTPARGYSWPSIQHIALDYAFEVTGDDRR